MSRMIQPLTLLISSFFFAPFACCQDNVQFKGSYRIEKGTQRGWLILEADIAKGYHIYALSDKKTAIAKSQIKIGESDEFELTKGFKPNTKPIVEDDPVLETQVHKHKGKVAFAAPIKVLPGAQAPDLNIEMKFHGQVCSDIGCFPLFNKPISVTFAGYYEKTDRQKRR